MKVKLNKIPPPPKDRIYRESSWLETITFGLYKTKKYIEKMNKLDKQNIIQIDLSGCKNWNECMKVIELITSGRVKIKVNEQIR